MKIMSDYSSRFVTLNILGENRLVDITFVHKIHEPHFM